MLRALLAIGFVIVTGCAPVQAEVQAEVQAQDLNTLFDGQWVNARGSGVVFRVQDGLLSGYYNTNLGAPDKAKKFALTGFVEGDQITFTVNFKGYGSMTSWTGQLSEDAKGDYIRTLWHLTRDVKDSAEADDLWKSITTGASDFRRAPTP